MLLPSPIQRLTTPLGFGSRSLLFVGDGNCLLLGDEGGFVSLFSLKARRALSVVSPSHKSCLPLPSLANPSSAAASASSTGSGTSSLLHIEPVANSSSSSSSRVLLQQRDSLISVFDLQAEKFTGSFRTGAFSFCKCAAPRRCSSSVGSSSSSSFSLECLAAPVGELESAGLFDLRALGPCKDTKGIVLPAVEFRLKRNSATEALFRCLLQEQQQQQLQQQHQQQLQLPSDLSSCGTLQCVGFVSSSPLLLTAYELPVVALWDMRSSRVPLSLMLLPPSDSPPAHLTVAGSRVWVACIEGPLSLQRVARSRRRKTDASAAVAMATVAGRRKEREKEAGESNANSICSDGSVSLVPLAQVRSFGTTSSSKGNASLDAFEGRHPHVASLAVRADGLVGACGMSYGAVELFEGKGLRTLGALKAHNSPVAAVTWCVSTGYLGSADKEGVVYLWSVYTDTYQSPSCSESSSL